MSRTKTKSAEEHRAEELAAHYAVNARNDYKYLAEVGRRFGFGMTIHTAATEWANLRLDGKPPLGAKWVATWLRVCADTIEHDEGRRPSYMEEHKKHGSFNAYRESPTPEDQNKEQG